MDYIIKKFDTVSSTNDIAKTEAEKGAAEGTVIVADAQEKGRGRLGRSFFSPDGGLYMSVVLEPEKVKCGLGFCTAAAALAVKESVALVCKKETELKWVNDLLLDGKKVCGILTELLDGALVVGVGINVARAPEAVPNAGCLADAGAGCSVEELAAAVIAELDALACGGGDCWEEYTAACLNLGREVVVIHGEDRRTAFAEAVDGDFGLVVRYPDGSRETLFYGEVSLRSPSGEYI